MSNSSVVFIDVFAFVQEGAQHFPFASFDRGLIEPCACVLVLGPQNLRSANCWCREKLRSRILSWLRHAAAFVVLVNCSHVPANPLKVLGWRSKKMKEVFAKDQ